MSSGNKDNDVFEAIVALAAVALSFVALREFFRNDSSDVVSSKGAKVLGDSDKMKEVRDKYSNRTQDTKEILINLD
jgi:hypothetical protein